MDYTSIALPIPTNGTGLLVVSWALSITWGVITLQLATYLQNRRRDHLVLQGIVIFLFACETASTVMACISVHKQLLILKPGSFEALFQLPQGFLIMNYFNHTTLCIVNLFLIWRYQRFAKSWCLAAPLMVLTLATLGLHFYMDTVGLISAPDYASGGSINIPAAAAFVSNQVVKPSKAAATLEFTVVTATYILMVIQLSSYLRQNLLSGRTILKRLLFITFESGTVTVALAAGYLAMVFSKMNPSGLTSIITCAARAYYMTMLFNLNWRNDGGLVMHEPSLTHLSKPFRGRSGVVQLTQTGSSGTGSKQTVIQLNPDIVIEDEEIRHFRMYVGFYKFIAPLVISGLNKLPGQVVSSYSNLTKYSNLKANELLGEYAKMAWN